MTSYSIEEITKIMSKPENIRNVSVIANKCHGKSTLTNCLVAKAGITTILNKGNQNITDIQLDEKDRGSSTNPGNYYLYYQYDLKGDGIKEPILVNLIDTPGRCEMSADVTTSLRVTDGAIVLVDFVEGVCVQTEMLLKQALIEKIKPVLIINKIDKGIHEHKLDSESMYQKYKKIIDTVNVIISTFGVQDMTDNQVAAEKGTVAFGSGLVGYTFTITQFARIYSKKFGIDKTKMMEKLWGDNYYDDEAKKWESNEKSSSGKTLKRSFCTFIMDPIIALSKSVADNKPEIYNKMLEEIGLTLTEEDKKATGNLLMKIIFQKWILGTDSLIEMMVEHLPSPKTAQKYRGPYLYEGPISDESAKGIIECNPQAPLMIYVSRIIPANDKGRFYAFGRVFSGIATAGLKCKIMGPNYKIGQKVDLFEKSINKICIMNGGKVEPVSEVPCGNTCGLVGIGEYLVNSGTISSDANAYALKCVKFNITHIVKVAIQPKNPKDLPLFIEALKKIAKSDLYLSISQSEENGCTFLNSLLGESHIEDTLKSFAKNYPKIEISHSNLLVNYKETVTIKTKKDIFVKSKNKHNRISLNAEPLAEDVIKAIESEKNSDISDSDDKRNALLKKIFPNEKFSKIWLFNPKLFGSNILFDTHEGFTNKNEIEDYASKSFESISKGGVLCEESLRGVRFNVVDISFHPDPIHRGSGQMIPLIIEGLQAAELNSQPRIQEPVYSCDIICPKDAIGGVYTALSTKKSKIVNELPVQGTNFTLIKSFIPVVETFGLNAHLRNLTSGKASLSQLVFDHWETIMDDPLDESTKIYAILEELRKIKGLKPGCPSIKG